MLHKLKSKHGETLVETIAALLIVSLASAAFASMIMAASRINTKAAEQDNTFYGELSVAESLKGTVRKGYIKISGDDIPGDQITVYISSALNDKLISYRIAKEDGT